MALHFIFKKRKRGETVPRGERLYAARPWSSLDFCAGLIAARPPRLFPRQRPPALPHCLREAGSLAPSGAQLSSREMGPQKRPVRDARVTRQQTLRRYREPAPGKPHSVGPVSTPTARALCKGGRGCGAAGPGCQGTSGVSHRCALLSGPAP